MTARTARRGLPARKPSPEGESPLVFSEDGLRYELDQAPKKSGKKIVVTVRHAAGGEAPPLVDNVSFYSHRSRLALATLVSETFGRETGAVMGHLALLLDQVERASAVEKKPEPIVLTQARKAAALKLLKAPDLVDRAVQAIGDLGYVGEERNKRLLYVLVTSRLLDDPLSGVLRAPPGTGKSDLIEKVVALLPEEAVESVTRLTSASLYYLGKDHLRHKAIVVDEQVGMAEVEHALRVLQSAGKLTLAYVKAGRTETFTVNGPVAVVSGTAIDHMNDENASRVIELTLDDSEEQTKLVLEAQRQAAAGGPRRSVNVEVFQDAQRLLEPLGYVLPFATKLAFPTASVQARRDQQKLLRLCGAHALLHQHQRPRDKEGRVVGAVLDYAAIYAMATPVVGATLDGLSARATALYRALVEGKLGEAFTRREVAAALGWAYMTATRALSELASHELVRVEAREKPVRYSLLDRSVLGSGATLTPPDALG